MKKQRYCYISAGLMIMAGLTSCSDTKEEPSMPDGDNPTVSSGLFVLNQGNYYSGIEGSLNMIDYSDGASQTEVFQKANGRSLGSTPQCGICYGSKVYLGVYDSNTIEIIDKNDYKSIRQIKLPESGYSGSGPRSMVATGGKVYISMFDGYVARLDTISLHIDASVQVGPNPETMAVYNGKLYVPNSDGMSMSGSFGTTACEIDLGNFTVTQTFNVPENPVQFMANETGLYLLCNGNYYDVEAKIYKIDPGVGHETIDNATVAAICGNYIYYVNDPFYGTGHADYKQYNLKTREISDWTIERPEYATSIYYDDLAGRIAISSLRYYGNIWPSYDQPGYVAVYDTNGTHLKDYDCGVGPSCIFKKSE